MICPRCQNEQVKPDHKYCMICGLPLSTNERKMPEWMVNPHRIAALTDIANDCFRKMIGVDVTDVKEVRRDIRPYPYEVEFIHNLLNEMVLGFLSIKRQVGPPA